MDQAREVFQQYDNILQGFAVDSLRESRLFTLRQYVYRYDRDGGGSIDATEFGSLCYDMGYCIGSEEEKKLLLQVL